MTLADDHALLRLWWGVLRHVGAVPVEISHAFFCRDYELAALFAQEWLEAGEGR